MESRTLSKQELDEMEGMKGANWVNGVKKTMVIEYASSAVVASGQAVFYLTDNGASNGSAVFTEVYKESVSFWVDDATGQYQYGAYTLSGDKKSITVNVRQLGVALGLLTFTTQPNGTTVYLRVKGK